MASRKLRLAGPADKFELAEVFSSGGQLCKERRLEDMDNPVGIQLLWPKVINAEVDRGMGLFTGYRSGLRSVCSMALLWPLLCGSSWAHLHVVGMLRVMSLVETSPSRGGDVAVDVFDINLCCG